ncbi:MAG: glycosyltransferase family 8 protein [Endomicrobium sp.]|jgi:lipopolysaccharide biosynthesis glycosyltransferase|nr:glycosyltransferase family 8 protein [Endomicrobium sp.]
MRIPVCFSCDNKYVPHLGVSITSILKNKNEDDNLVFYVLDGGISKENKEKLLSLKSIANFEIKFVKVDNSRFSEIRVYGKDHITDASYYRLILPDICNREDKIIYLDCDLVVRTSLYEMMEIDLKNYYVGAVLDSDYIEQEKRLNLKQYINSGVLLLNVLAWHRDNITAKLFDWAKNNKKMILYHDQDIINGALEKSIKIIDSTWNTQISKIEKRCNNFDKILSDAKIIHYVAYKPWNAHLRFISMEWLYFKYLAFTPWKNLKYKFKLKNKYATFRFFIKWLACIRNISKEYKVIQIFGKSVIKFRRKNRYTIKRD